MRKYDKIKVTTTSSLQNVEIQEYLEPISVSIVVGMNFFKDFLSGFRDIFGGKSTTYTKSLEKINQQAINELKKRAYYLNANYVIGLTIENDEIASQGKSMLMVTAMGTAVKVLDKNKEYVNNSNAIGLEIFKQLEVRAKLIKTANNGNLKLNEENWNLIIENQISELSSFLLNQFSKHPNSIEFKEYLKTFFENIDREVAENEVFNFMNKSENIDLTPIFKLIKDLNLVSYERNIELLKSGNNELIKIGSLISGVHKKTYSKSDINILKKTITEIENQFPIQVEYYTTTDKLIQREVKVWKCQCGKENNVERQICKSCNRDIYGLKNSNLNLKEIIESLKTRIEVLENNFA